jgi:dipeptidyl aminopeptidase/acylaminoacyl peptidase
VPVDNSLAIATAMRARKIPFELHLYPEGRHGLALSHENPHVATWFGLCCEWLKGLGWKG